MGWKIKKLEVSGLKTRKHPSDHISDYMNANSKNGEILGINFRELIFQ